MPQCPDHPTAVLREGKYGLFCPTKLPDGSWCKFKVKAAPKTEAVPVPQPVPLPKARLAEAALAFAGQVFHGSGNPNEALAAAASAYNWLVNGTDTDINF